MVFDTVVCGGTFDHFHKGHESLLKFAFSSGEKVIVGITSDDYIKKTKLKGQDPKLIEGFKQRQLELLEFLKKEKFLNKVEIIKIKDVFGSTLTKDKEIDAIVVSPETKKGAEIINKKRKELELKELKILIAPYVYAEDGKLISSERIRDGEINRVGQPYIKPSWFNMDLVLTQNLREELKKPLGILTKDLQQNFRDRNLIATVGDVTTKKFNLLSLNQKISVIDFKVAREKIFSKISDLGFMGNEKVIKIENLILSD